MLRVLGLTSIVENLENSLEGTATLVSFTGFIKLNFAVKERSSRQYCLLESTIESNKGILVRKIIFGLQAILLIPAYRFIAFPLLHNRIPT